jgi:hypothetical protein
MKPLLVIPRSGFVAYDTEKLGLFQFEVPVPATGAIRFVNTHTPSNGLSFIVGDNANRLLIFALKSPAGNSTGVPKLLKAAIVNLGHPLGTTRVNPVFRDGKLYLATKVCTAPAGNGSCTKYVAHLYRVPVALSLRRRNGCSLGPRI